MQEYVGGYSDWLRHTQKLAAAKAAGSAGREPARAAVAAPAAAAKPRAGKLSFKEARELAEAPGRIEVLEREQAELSERLGEPAFYRSEPAAQTRVHARIAELAKELAEAYARWEGLETRRGG